MKVIKNNFKRLMIFTIVAIMCLSIIGFLPTSVASDNYENNDFYTPLLPEMRSLIPINQPNMYPMGLSNALVAGANYLVHAQADITEDNAGNGLDGFETPEDPDDGGWDWVSTIFTHSTSASSTNLFGVTAMGLYYAYLETSDPAYMTAMDDVAVQMAIDATIDSGPDITFLILYDDIKGSPGTWD